MLSGSPRPVPGPSQLWAGPKAAGLVPVMARSHWLMSIMAGFDWLTLRLKFIHIVCGELPAPGCVWWRRVATVSLLSQAHRCSAHCLHRPPATRAHISSHWHNNIESTSSERSDRGPRHHQPQLSFTPTFIDFHSEPNFQTRSILMTHRLGDTNGTPRHPKINHNVEIKAFSSWQS